MTYLVEITKPLRANDIHREFALELDAAIDAASADAGDGYRIIQYKPGGAVSLRENSKAMLRTHGELLDGETTYDTLAEAETAIAALNASDGYELIDLEQPIGSAPSIIVETRPTLWQRSAVTIAQRENGHSRTDLDRY